MKTILSLIIVISFVISGCGDSDKNSGSGNTNNNSGNNSGNNNTTPNTNSTPTNEPPKTEIRKQTPQHERNDNSTRVEFPRGSTEVTLNGKINGLGDNITYVFNASKGQNLNASVGPATKTQANLRFNQLFFPSGKIDGPFGNSLTQELTESGDWKIVVGESNMEGTPYTGEFLLTISIK